MRRFRSRTRTSCASSRSRPLRFTVPCSLKTPSRPPSATGRKSTASKCRPTEGFALIVLWGCSRSLWFVGAQHAAPLRGTIESEGYLKHLNMATEVASPNIAKMHLTERAAQKIRALLEKEGVSPEVGGLRVGVQGGGCSGLSYAMRL